MILAIRQDVRQQVRHAFKRAKQQLKRYFLILHGVNQYIKLSTEIALTGDFEITGKFALSSYPASGKYALILGRSNNSDSSGFVFFGMSGDNATRKTITLSAKGGSRDFTFAQAIGLNKSYEFVLTRKNGALSLKLNNQSSVTSSAQFTSTIAFDSLGANQYGHCWAGVLADFTVSDKGNRVLDMPIDERSISIKNKAVNNNGTYINGALSDFKLFVKKASGWVLKA